MGTKRNVRLIDIANTLGLTVNTVSRALRDKSDIGEETKEIVKKTAYEMGYIPNTIASSLRKGSSKTIAIVFDNLVNPYFMIMADKIHRKLEPLGYATMIFAGNNGQFDSDLLIPIVSRKIDGILTFLEPTEEVLNILNLNDIPIVLVGRINTKLKLDCIATDDFQGAYKIGELFISKGAKRCGYLGAPISVECSRRRMDGYKKAISDFEKKVYNEDFLFVENDEIEKCLSTLINNGVDSIFCFNDMIALEVFSLLKNKHIKVPEEVKIAGFDYLQKEFVWPINLTTISSDKDGIIDLAVETIMHHIKKDKAITSPKYIDFKVELIEGETT